MSERDVDDLAEAYLNGSTLNELAQGYAIHRTTVMRYLDRRGIARRRNGRKLTDRAVKVAAEQHRRGLSLNDAAGGFDVDASTLARELRRADVLIPPRRGWPPSS